MGWLWFIPTFHMTPQATPSTSSETETVHLKLTKKELDFPLGAGAWIIDVDIQLEWVPDVDPEAPASRQRSGDEIVSGVVNEEEKGIIADVVGAVSGLTGGGDVIKAAENVEAVQG